MSAVYREETIDLVKTVKDAFPRLNNNLSMKMKNIERRKIKLKKRQTFDLILDEVGKLIIADPDISFNPNQAETPT